MRKILFSLLGLASVLPGCGPGLDTDSFHPGSIDGALFWYKAEQASLPSGANVWSWLESLGSQTGLTLTGQGTASAILGNQGQALVSLSAGAVFSMAYPAQPLNLGEFSAYAVMQGKTAVDGGILGIFSGNVSASVCPSSNLSLRVTGGQLIGEVWNSANSTPVTIPASTELSVVELRYGRDGILRLQAAGQSSFASGPFQSVSITVPKVALGAACLNFSGTPPLAQGNVNLGEVLFYNRAVSESESLRIRRYLMLRYGVTQ